MTRCQSLFKKNLALGDIQGQLAEHLHNVIV